MKNDYFKTIEDEDYLPGVNGFSSESSLDNMLQILWRRRWVGLIVTGVCLVVALVYVVMARPIYTSTARIYVEQTGPKIISEQEGVMTRSKNYLYTQRELLKSNPIIADVLKKPGIRGLKTFGETSHPENILKQSLEVQVGKKDGIINVTIESPFPKEAPRIVNAIVDSYYNYHAKHKRTSARDVLDILQKDKEKSNREREEKLKALLSFTKRNGTVSFENGKGNIVMQRLGKLTAAMTEAELELVDARTQYESINAMVKDPRQLRQFVQSKQANEDHVIFNRNQSLRREELQKEQGMLKSLMRELTIDHPEVQETWIKIDRLQRRIAEQENEFAQACRTAAVRRMMVAMQKEREIKNALEKQKQLALLQGAKATEHTMLQSELKQVEEHCDTISQRIKEINVAEDTGALNISILETAQVAQKPSRPDKTRIMSMALAFGIVLGLMLIFAVDWMDHRIQNADEVTHLVGSAVLGSVASMSRKMFLSETARNQAAYLRPASAVAESYRSIRTALYYGNGNGSGGAERKGKTLLVTSPERGDGKTTLVSNLAITMAQAGRRTLVIDADFRKPKQHLVFRVKQNPGLMGVLSNGRIDMLEHAIQSDVLEIAGLDILPSGGIQKKTELDQDDFQEAIRQSQIKSQFNYHQAWGPSELLNSHHLREALSYFSTKYDRIIIDAPPVNDVADARILGAVSDETLLVIKDQKSTRKAVRYARDRLMSVGANITGVVVNNVSDASGRYQCYNSYGYYGRRENACPPREYHYSAPPVRPGAETSRAGVIRTAHGNINLYEGVDTQIHFSDQNEAGDEPVRRVESETTDDGSKST